MSFGERNFDRPRGNRNFRPRFNGPREMHKAICSDCGKETEVPFKPSEGRPVYCKECFLKKKQQG